MDNKEALPTGPENPEEEKKIAAEASGELEQLIDETKQALEVPEVPEGGQDKMAA